MLDFETLMTEHDLLDRQAGALLDAVDRRALDDALAASATLSRTLAMHLAKEDALLYEQLVASTDGSSADTARRFSVEFADLKTCWTTYLSTWDGASIAADWAGYGDRTAHVIGQLRDRIRRENELLYPLALRAALITLRPAA